MTALLSFYQGLPEVDQKALIALTLGLGLGVAIDLVRECGDQLVA